MPDIDLVPLQAQAMQPSTSTLEVYFEFDTMDDGTNHAVVSGSFNGASWDPVTYNAPLVPATMSALTLGDNATTSEAYGPLSFAVGHLEVLDIVLRNGDSGKHPLYDLPLRILPSVLTDTCTATCTGTKCRSSTTRRTIRATTPP